jgi:hypothetical protein
LQRPALDSLLAMHDETEMIDIASEKVWRTMRSSAEAPACRSCPEPRRTSSVPNSRTCSLRRPKRRSSMRSSFVLPVPCELLEPLRPPPKEPREIRRASVKVGSKTLVLAVSSRLRPSPRFEPGWSSVNIQAHSARGARAEGREAEGAQAEPSRMREVRGRQAVAERVSPSGECERGEGLLADGPAWDQLQTASG